MVFETYTRQSSLSECSTAPVRNVRCQFCEKDRNTATYALMYNWQTDVVYGQDTGENGASRLEYPVRFAVDSYQYFDDMLPGLRSLPGAGFCCHDPRT